MFGEGFLVMMGLMPGIVGVVVVSRSERGEMLLLLLWLLVLLVLSGVVDGRLVVVGRLRG